MITPVSPATAGRCRLGAGSSAGNGEVGRLEDGGCDATGPASGPGCTGAEYTFTATTRLTGPLHTLVSTSGTADVDQQGRVRQVDALESFAGTKREVKITFGDFGLPVSVSTPPASQTFTP